MKHMVIVGGGTIGAFLAKRIAAEEVRVTMIDQDPLVLRSLQQQLDIAAYTCNATNFADLEKAGISEADLFVATTRRDETNLIACLLADTLNIQRKIAVTRYLGAKGHTWVGLKQTGTIVNISEAVCGQLMETLHLVGVHEQISFAGGELVLIGMQLHSKSKWVGQPVEALMRSNPDMRVTHVVRGDYSLVCTEKTLLQANDHLYLVVLKCGLERAHQVLGVRKLDSQRALIVGGNFLAEMIAETLSKHHFQVTLMATGERLSRLEQNLKIHKNVQVVTGDGSLLEDLQKHQAGKSGLFIAVTSEDTSNLTACMLAKSLGVRKTIASIKQPELEALAFKGGIDDSISPHLSTARAIQHQLHQEEILDYHAITQTNLEVVELRAHANCRITRAPLGKLHLPKGSVLAALINGNKAMLPPPTYTVQANEKALMLIRSEALSETESWFVH